MDKEEWINKFTIYCDNFDARISVAQCMTNRKKAINGESGFKICLDCSKPDEESKEETVLQCDICEEEYPTSCFDEDEDGEIVKQCCYCQQKYYLGKYAKED